MARPRIVQTDEQIGFRWTTPAGMPTTLARLVEADDEPDRLLATHLEALDDALIAAAGRFGDVLGGGRGPSRSERDELAELYRSIDGLCHGYAVAAARTGTVPGLRAGQIIGTAALVSIFARRPLGLLGAAPFEGELDDPGLGVLGGFGEFQQVDPARPWLGGRWVLRTETGRRYPLTLAMMLFDSSGVNKEGALAEHRAALRSLIGLADNRVPEDERLGAGERIGLVGALDWLLYDWLIAHRDGPDSAAIEIPAGREEDAALIVDAVAASAAVRSTVDPSLVLERR